MGRINKANIKKTVYYLKRNGIKNTWYAARERMEEAKHKPYSYIAPTSEELARQREELLTFRGKISVVVPTYHTASEYLREMIDSVRVQTYPNWELILADASTDDSVEKIVKQYAEERIVYIRLKKNAGIAENTNAALAYVTGEYVGLLDHDDVLTEDALYEMAVRISQGARMIYSDEDKCNSDRTQYYEPHFKEDFNLDLVLSNNYICHFLVMESVLMKELKFRPEYDGAQDYDLVLRAAERLWQTEEWIAHVPKVLYHWRCHMGSTAENPQSKQYAYEAGRRALQNLAERQGWNAEAVHLKHLGFYRLEYKNDLFAYRNEVAAVGGRILKGGKIIGGRMTLQGESLYKGMPAVYSGYMHRAVLTQNAEAVDVRCIRVRKECIPLFEKITGVTYRESAKTSLFDSTTLPKDTDYVALSIALSKGLREAGYHIIYDPTITAKW